MSSTGRPGRCPGHAGRTPPGWTGGRISSNVNSTRGPSSSTITSAGRVWPSAMTSNQSCAQLKWPSSSGNERPPRPRPGDPAATAAHHAPLDILRRRDHRMLPCPSQVRAQKSPSAGFRRLRTSTVTAKRMPGSHSCVPAGHGPHHRRTGPWPLTAGHCRSPGPEAPRSGLLWSTSRTPAGRRSKRGRRPGPAAHLSGYGRRRQGSQRGGQRPPGVANTLNLGTGKHPASGSVQ